MAISEIGNEILKKYGIRDDTAKSDPTRAGTTLQINPMMQAGATATGQAPVNSGMEKAYVPLARTEPTAAPAARSRWLDYIYVPPQRTQPTTVDANSISGRSFDIREGVRYRQMAEEDLRQLGRGKDYQVRGSQYSDRARQILAKYGLADYTNEELLDAAEWKHRYEDYGSKAGEAYKHLGGSEWSDLEGDEQHRKNVDLQVQAIEREMARVGPTSPSYAAMKYYHDQLVGMQGVYKDRANLYGSFSNQYEYDVYRHTQKELDTSWKKAEMKGQTRKEWADGLAADADKADAKAERAQWEMDVINKQLEVIEQVRGMAYSDEAMQKMVHEDGTPYTREEVEARYEYLLKEKEKYQKALDDAEYARTIANAAKDYSYQQRYSDLREQDDWQSSVEAGRTAWAPAEKAIAAARANRAAETRAGNVEVAGLSDEELAGEDYYTYRTPDERFTNEERNTWYYLYNRDPEEAFEYAIGIHRRNKARARAEQMQRIQEWGGENWWHGILATGYDLIAWPTALWDTAGNLFQYANTGLVMPNDELSPSDYGDALTAGVAAAMNNWGTIPDYVPILGGKGWGEAYQLGISIAQSMEAAALGGGAANVLFFGAAAKHGTEEALARGASDGQAIIYGLWCGAAEVLGETVSVEHLVHLKNAGAVKSILKNILIQGGIEASEEVVTTMINTVGDAIVMGDKSELETNARAYMAQGMSKDEAYKRAWREWSEGIILDAVGGFLSGGISSGATYASRGIRGAHTAYSGDQQALLTLAEQQGNERAVEKAREIREKGYMTYNDSLVLRESIPEYALSAFDEQQQSAEQDQIRQDASRSLLAQGAGQDTAQRYAELVMKDAAGEKMTRAERAQYREAYNAPEVQTAFRTAKDLQNERDIFRSVAARDQMREAKARIREEKMTRKLAEQRGGDLHNVQLKQGGGYVKVKSAEMQNGKLALTYETPNGDKTATVDELKLDEYQQAAFRSLTQILGKDAAAAYNGMSLRTMENGGFSIIRYASAFANVRDLFGAKGASLEAAKASSISRGLTAGQVEQAWTIGRQMMERGETRAEERPKSKRGTGSVSTNGFTYKDSEGKQQKMAGVKNAEAVMKSRKGRLLQALAKSLGIDVVLFEGDADSVVNGAYDNGTIYLEWSSFSERAEGKGSASWVMFRTMSHELTHFIQQNSKDTYAELKDFITGYLRDFNGLNFNALVAEKIAREPGISYDRAIDEVVADACETMLKDSKAARKLMRENMTLWEKICDFVSEFLDKIQAQDDAAKALQPVIDQVREIWDRGLMEAVESREMKAEVLERSSEALTEIDPTAEAATVTLPDGSQHSIRSMRHDIAEGKMFEDLEKYTDMSHEEVQELRKGLERLTDIIALNRDILDMNETVGKDNRTFKPFKPNSDPLYTISLDFSTLCRKRLMTQYVIEKLQTELTDSQTGKRGRPLTAEEQLAVRDLMKEYAQQEKALKVACAMCYVEAARLKAPAQIQRFMRDPTEPMRRYFALRNSEFNASVREAQADFKEQRGYPRNVAKSAMKPADVTALNKLSNQLRNGYQMSAEEQREIEIAKALPNETYLTAANLANLAEEHPVIYDAYTATIRTATRSKSLEADIPYYYGDSEGAVSDKFIEDVNRENGMRFSSWSDFQIQHMLDMMTAVIELSVRHCAMHGYTKFLEQVRIFGKTGMMFNMSGVPSATGLKADGSLDFSTTDSVLVHGQDGEYDAVQAREDFPETAGLQCIGMSNKHIMALLASDIMDYIIPYHTSGMNATLRRMAQIYSWDDFTPFQNAKVDDRIKFDPKVHDKSTWHQEPVFSEFFNAAKQESNGYRAGEKGVVTMRRAADLYKQMCRERGMMPKFSWGNSKVDADFSNDPNYWKLLIDRKMINQKTGALIEQKAVRPDFEFGLIEKMVQAEVDAYDPGLQDRALNYVRDHLDELPQRITDLKKAGAVKKITGRKTNKAAKTLQAGPVAAMSEANAAGAQLSTRGSWNSLSQEEKDQAVKENRAFNESQTKTGSKLVTLKGSDISRGGTLAGIRYPVGKIIGGRLYIHKSYADTIGDIDPKFRETLVNAEEALREEYPDFQYNCINYHPASGEIQFQEAPDFDTAREPVVGMQINVQADGTVTEANRGKPFQQIWHHKWQWVGNDYKGFNVRQSWEWSKEWLSTILGASKGGSMRAWNEQLGENGLPEDGGTAQFSARPVSQQFSSEDTSINQNKLPSVFTKGWFTKELKDGGVNIDIGGGKYDNAAEYLKQYGVTNMVFDPFNRNRSHNKGVLDYVMSGKRADTVTCANVLNVIQEPAARENVILECAKAMKPDGKAFFLIYEGDKTGNGRTTKTPVRDQNGVIQHDENGKTLYSTSWQEHRDAKSYLEEIKQYFDVAVPHGNLIVAEKPKADLPQAAWQLDKEGETVQFSVRSNGKGDQTQTQQFKKWFGNSKVVDEDGKPLVVYHGTEADFTVFDRSKGRSTMDIQGMFFSPWEIEAEGYGSKVGAYYLSIQNPAPEGIAYKALNMFKGQNNAGIRAREYLEARGYDGVQGYDEWIAFRPEQIKSATDNTGAFDRKNPDVRFSLRSDGKTDRELLKNAYKKMLADKQWVIDEQNKEAKAALEKFQKQVETYEAKEREVTAALDELDRLVQDGTDPKAVTDARAKVSAKESQMANALNRLTESMNGTEIQEILQRERKIQRERTSAKLRESVSRRELRGKINKLWKDLNARITKPSETKHIPAELMQQTMDVLEALNMDTSREGTKSGEKLRSRLANLKQRYSELRNDPDFEKASVYDPVIEEMLGNMIAQVGDTPINKMSVSQMEIVYNVLKAMDHTARAALKLKLGEIEVAAYTVAKEMTKETRSVKKQRGFGNAYLKATLSPQRMFNRLGGHHKNSVWSRVATMLNDGQLKQTQLQMEGSMIFEDLLASKSYEGMIDPKKTVDVGLKDENGKAIPITHGMMVSLYLHLMNEQNRRHVAYGGLTIPALKDYYNGKKVKGSEDAVRVGGALQEIAELKDQLHDAEKAGNENEIAVLESKLEAAQIMAESFVTELQQTIEQQLTDYDRQWIAACRELFDGFSKRVLNETTMAVYGIKKANVENYFPIWVDGDFLNTPFESVSKDMSLENAGFMKERVDSSKPIRLGDVSDVTAQQIRKVAQYCGMMPAIRDFGKIWGKTETGYRDSLQKAVHDTFGDNGVKYIENLMADLNGARSGENDAASEFFNRVRGHMAQASLTMSLRVALGQTASYPTAAAVLGWDALHKALWHGGRSNRLISRADQELIRKWSPLLYYRMKGYSNTELGDIAGMNDKWSRLWKKARWITGWIQAMDGATVGRLWYAAEYWVQDHNKALVKGTDSYYEAVAKKFNEVVELTQPNYTAMQRPDILRNPNALVKQLTMFLTQRLQNFNILYDAAATYSAMKEDFKAGRNGVTREDVKQAAVQTRTAVVSQLAAAATITVFKFLADVALHSLNVYRDDDDKELHWQSVCLGILDMFIDSLTGNFLGGSEVWDLAESLIPDFNKSYYGIEVSGVGVVNDLIDAGLRVFTKGVKGELSWKDTDKLIKQVGTILGIPYANAEKIVMAAVYYVQDAVNGEWLWNSSAGVDRTTAQQATRLLRAYREADGAKVNKILAEVPEDKRSSVYETVRKQIKKDFTDGKITIYEALRQMQKYGNASDQVMANFIKGQLADGKISGKQAEELLVQYGGRSEKSAEETVTKVEAKAETGIAYDDIDDSFMLGQISRDDAKNALVRYGMDEDKAEMKVNWWEYQKNNPGTSLTESGYEAYITKYQAIGLSMSQYEYYAARKQECQGTDANNDGKADRGSKKAQVVELINSMDLTPAQKDEMYLANGYAKSGLVECPWNR